jgi:hypothetical protein
VKTPTRNTTLRSHRNTLPSRLALFALFALQFYLIAYFADGNTGPLRQTFQVLIDPLMAISFGALGFYLFYRRESEPDQGQDLALTVDISTDIAKAAESLTAVDVVKRIAGIYALESLAGTGPDNQKVAVNILSAFVRERSSPQIEGWQRSSWEASSSDIELALKSLSSLRGLFKTLQNPM